MKKKMMITSPEGHVIYEGKALEIPIKMSAIQAKSMELFRDPDPCIIHQSYAIQKLVTPLVDYLSDKKEMKISEIQIDISWIDLTYDASCSIALKG